MRGRELRALLDEVPDTRELILRHAQHAEFAWAAEYDAWNDAHEEAEGALASWLHGAGAETYAAYRAAQDREDAAQDALFRAVAADRVAAAVAAARLGLTTR